MNKNTSTTSQEPGIGQVLRDDFRRIDFKRSLPRDYADLKEFFLDDARKARLSEMRRAKRWVYTTVWLLKSLFFKLTPARRALLTIGVILLLFSNGLQYTNG